MTDQAILIVAPAAAVPALAGPFRAAGAQVVVAATGRDACEQLRARQRGGRQFAAVVVDSALADDPRALVGDLRRIDPRCARCLACRSDGHGRGLERDAASLGVRHVLPHPPTPLHAQRLLAEGAGSGSGSRGGSQTGGNDTPFFGTRRLAAPTTGRHTNPDFTPSASPRSPEHQPLPVDPFEQQLPPEQRQAPPQRSATRTYTSTRVRRGVGGRLSDDQQARVEREATRRIGSDQRRVRCPHCGGAFAVVLRSRSYTTPCIHCGQLNTIGAQQG